MVETDSNWRKHKKTIQIENCYSTQQIKECLGFEIHYEKKDFSERGVLE